MEDLVPRCDHTTGCITCGDEAIAMRGAARRRRPRPGALRRRGRRQEHASRRRWSSRSRPATGCSSTPAPRSRGRHEGAAVKFVDEFRDAELGQVARRRDPRRGRPRPPLQADGGLRRPHPLDLQLRDRRPAARERRARPRPGLPGLRDPDGAGRRRDRDRPQRGRDLHLLRRHDAGARLRAVAARGEGRGRRRADGLLAARRAADRQGEPRPRGRLLRDRLRDDRPLDGADDEAGEGRGRRRTSSACATT